MLIDTPEDIAVACDRQNIKSLKYLSISHKDPDHTRGIRMVESIGYNWITEKSRPVEFIALPEVVEDINNWNGNMLKYYNDVLKCISINEVNYIKINDIEINLINNKTNGANITFYLLREKDSKAIYACCNSKPFIHNDMYYDADVLIIGLVTDDGVLVDGTKVEDAPFKNELFTLDEIRTLKRKYRIKKVIITHIDEIWGKSYGFYNELEKKLDNILFAYDGMEIIV